MPTRAETIAEAIRIFEGADYPSGQSEASAWLGIYQTLLWYEPVNWLGYIELPHIVDSNLLRPASPQTQKGWITPSKWQGRAQAITEYLAVQLDCPVSSVPAKLDMLMKHPDYMGRQRQNSLGIAFAGLITHILHKFGSAPVVYETEVPASTVFPGVVVPGRSDLTRIDAVAHISGQLRVVISAKWSLRHDRLRDVSNECVVYKRSYEQVHSKSESGNLLYYLVTNEYEPARLKELLADPCLDGVVHVHKAAVVDMCGLNGRLEKLMDLTDLIRVTSSW